MFVFWFLLAFLVAAMGVWPLGLLFVVFALWNLVKDL